MEAIQTAASQTLLNLALGVIALLGAYGMYFVQKAAAKVQAQTAQIKDDAQRKLFTDALADVENLAIVTVGSIEQTTAATLRKAVKSGKADRNTLIALGQQAFEEVKTAIAPEVQEVIDDNLGSFDEYLTKLIEDAVRRVKQEDPDISISSEMISSNV